MNNLNIIYEDSDIIIINKPPFLLTHPIENTKYNFSLVTYLLKSNVILYNSDKDNIRPGVVHRLDKDTSGAIIFAKNKKAFLFLKQAFLERKVYKEYLAIVHGKIKYATGSIIHSIKRNNFNRMKRSISPADNFSCKNARTDWKIKKILNDHTIILCYLHTGRTHQIRVHLKSIGHPIVGDIWYGNKNLDKKLALQNSRLMLHSFKIGINMPNFKDFKIFKADIDADFKQKINLLS